MALHPKFPTSPYAPLIPEQRWLPADEALRSTAYEKLLPPLVSKLRKEVHTWREKGYAGASPTSVALLRHWFETVRFDGKTYTSPSLAGAAARNYRTCNGWVFWQYERAPGDWVPLDQLRK